MQKIDFNENWKYKRVGEKEYKNCFLPHDAQIYEGRVAGAQSGVNLGWYECFDYEYAKTFFIPEEYKNKVLTFEFEGVYRNAEIYINGVKAHYRPYGYTNFFVEANAFLRFGEENEITVFAKNADQPNSRWYSGAGIYRPVYLWVAEKAHIKMNGVKVRTLKIHPAVVEISVEASQDGEVKIEINDQNTNVIKRAQTQNGRAKFTVEISDAKLWSPQNPAIYALTTTFFDDVSQNSFGIRTISLSPQNGFLLNGERVILRGACIHHDNGVLGARCLAEAEKRKIKILKENGYNAIRSAHNPCSKALLDACDELGVMVVDEYADAWFVHKTKHDYAECVTDWYKQDLRDMVEKDFNHPCVVMYSLGNEVAETGQKKGVELFKDMKAVCREIDAERPITAGVNLFFNWLYAMGFGVYSDNKANKNPNAKVGSEFFNELAGLTGAGFMKRMATLYPCDALTYKCFAEMDAAGYNYGILRYKKDLKKYKDRIILGSETFCSDAYRFWELAKSHPALIGDFVWSGMDYLGEVGIGSWEYREYAPDFNKGVGWLSAGSGRVDLIGTPLGEALYTKVAFELEKAPQIAVVPVSHTNERHSPSAWKFSNAIPSWSWNGLNGSPARVEVYARSPFVELFINGKSVGRKKRAKNNCRFTFKTKYYDGEICAVSLDEGGNELCKTTLKTAGEQTVLSVLPEKLKVKQGEACFINLAFTDTDGVVKPLEKGKINIKVEGGTLLGLGHACPYNAEGFINDYTNTYYGRALAVVKATGKTVKIIATAKNLHGECEIGVE
ncbi:MAG: glycoside hydrolase family 2 protein [Clostridiales bacterium]|nr:glycoside hydrolase family 2 protein [Clostridiales bacterium]